MTIDRVNYRDRRRPDPSSVGGVRAYQLTQQRIRPQPPTNVKAASILKGIAVSWDPLESVDYLHSEVYVSATQGFTPNRDTLKATIRGSLAEITEGLIAGTTYYARVVHVNRYGMKSTPSAEVSAQAAYADSSTVRLLHDISSAIVLTPPDFEVRKGPSADAKPTWPIQKVDEWDVWRDIPGTEVTVALNEPSIVHYIMSGSGEFRAKALASRWDGSSPPPADHCANIGLTGNRIEIDSGDLFFIEAPPIIEGATDKELADAITIKFRVLVDGNSVAEFDFTDAARMYVYTFGLQRPQFPLTGASYCYRSYEKTIGFPFPITISQTIQLGSGNHTAKAQVFVQDNPDVITWGAISGADPSQPRYTAFWAVAQLSLRLLKMNGFALVVR